MRQLWSATSAALQLGEILMRFFAGLAALLVGGILAATLVRPASAQTFRVTDDWVTLRPPGAGFSILMPPDWRQDPPRTPNAKLSFIAEQPAPSGRPGGTNCRVISKALPDTAEFTQAKIDELYKAPAPPDVVQEITSTFGDAAVRENRLVRVSNLPAWFISVSGSYESLNAKVYGVGAFVQLIHRRQSYVVFCGAFDTTKQRSEAAWSAWQPIIIILGTFTIEDY